MLLITHTPSRPDTCSVSSFDPSRSSSAAIPRSESHGWALMKGSAQRGQEMERMCHKICKDEHAWLLFLGEETELMQRKALTLLTAGYLGALCKSPGAQCGTQSASAAAQTMFSHHTAELIL
ncbi:hypothetical protein EYF80_009769 [Liparis tanakae]|uniref:Uncharacterized protein n=1 Tax=Liparis tanakae TaxID=230148 RepID=A0A4Z2IRS0_9TELE|nr:hypothetical protein EYF80_009769 [Liparis tanakae]